MDAHLSPSSGGNTNELASQLVRLLREKGQTLAFCESLSAGLASASIAAIPGASAVLRGGLVTYATELKMKLAGVPREIVEQFGVVSAECAAAMAQGTQQVCESDWAVSLTGVAGPEKQDGRPVGEVWIGIAGPPLPEAEAETKENYHLENAMGTIQTFPAFKSEQQVILAEQGRNIIREAAVAESFRLLIQQIECD
ncbi:CinA family protein [Corynebacterium callunae]|uniref:CinA family protein n=1 Tax=Corynebacterium callunae TaxID=1721 RepID=UPI0039827DB3